MEKHLRCYSSMSGSDMLMAAIHRAHVVALIGHIDATFSPLLFSLPFYHRTHHFQLRQLPCTDAAGISQNFCLLTNAPIDRINDYLVLLAGRHRGVVPF